MGQGLQSIHGRFQEVVQTCRDRTAIVGNERSLTYGELNDLSGALAARLVREGVGARMPVLTCIDRSPEAFVAMLAILKAGAAYVPMDPSYPASVKQTYIQGIGARYAIVRQQDPAEMPDVPGLHVLPVALPEGWISEAAPVSAPPAGADDPAYVMFTSGSTGRPKGVLVPHRGILRLVCGANFIQVGEDDTVLQLSPLTFDASTFEIWGALLNGGRLVLYEGKVFDPNAVNALVRRERVSVMWLTAALFHLVVRRCPQMFGGLRALLAGGDVLQPDAVRTVLRMFPGLAVINGYGPTENTTFTCCHVMTAAAMPGDPVPIGTPVTGTTVHVLDEDLRPVPSGEVGELYAGGQGVALEYVNAPEQSAVSFIADPFEAGKRLYKTGDLVREIADSVYEFVGRVDNQVKIRGYRISIEEVQRVLNGIHGVADGAICVQKDSNGEKRLAAFVQSDDDPERLKLHIRSELARALPHFMVPDVIRVERELPVNSNGKLDRSKLSLR